ncbi:MAG: hypothetical protein L0177_13090 [Chloroflexi bacterium]|nr:hypothetical protein [Chloroflexota bacterium]
MRIDIRRCTVDDWAALAMVHRHWAKMYEHVFAPQAEVYSGFVDDVLIGAAGFLFHAPRQAYCWAAFLPWRWPRYPRRLLEAIGEKRDAVIAAHELWRLEARADCASVVGCRFLELLGFRCEGIMRAANEYGDDQFLYSLLTTGGQTQRGERQHERYSDGVAQIRRARIEYLLWHLEGDVHGDSRYCSGLSRRGGDCGDHIEYPGLESSRA